MTPWDLPERLRSNIRVTTDDCWVWTGRRRAAGYGQAKWQAMNTSASRIVYTLLVGPIEPGLHIDHLCRTRPCVNPLHLEPVTQAENQRRRSLAITHCRYGHEFTPDNTYEYVRGSHHQRCCKACTFRRLESRTA